LGEGRLHALGTPMEGLEEKTLAGVFQAPVSVMHHPVLGVPLVFLDGRGGGLLNQDVRLRQGPL